jgi:hypothetical protein
VIEVPADALPPPPLSPPDDPPAPPPVLPIASAATRLGAFALDLVILAGGLGIGWVIWAAATVASSRGPGKHVLHLRLVEVATGAPARWYYTATRELVLKLPLLAALLVAAKAIGGTGDAAVVAVAFVVLGLVAVSSVGSVWGGRSMFDLLVGTVVVDERRVRPALAVPTPQPPALDEPELSDRVAAGTEPR